MVELHSMSNHRRKRSCFSSNYAFKHYPTMFFENTCQPDIYSFLRSAA